MILKRTNSAEKLLALRNKQIGAQSWPLSESQKLREQHLGGRQLLALAPAPLAEVVDLRRGHIDDVRPASR
jgi:hypothetical protein